jgi:hypothetical protein
MGTSEHGGKGGIMIYAVIVIACAAAASLWALCWQRYETSLWKTFYAEKLNELAESKETVRTLRISNHAMGEVLTRMNAMLGDERNKQKPKIY